MAAVTVSKRAESITNFTTGSFTGDGTATIINLGYDPLWAFVVNETDATTWEKIDPMVAANSVKTIAVGTMTLDATSAIVFNGDKTVTLSAGVGVAAKAIKFLFRR